MDKYLEPTFLLDFNDQRIQNLIRTKGWNDLEEKGKILQIYNFVRDAITSDLGIYDNPDLFFNKYSQNLSLGTADKYMTGIF